MFRVLVIDDGAGEADPDEFELVQELHSRGYAVVTKPAASVSAQDLHPDHPILGSSDILQRLLTEAGLPVINTYPDFIRPLMKRAVTESSARDLLAPDGSVFVKPVHGHKLGRTGLWQRGLYQADELLYVCPLVNFESEWRLYICPGRQLLGLCDYSDRLFQEDPWESLSQMEARFEAFASQIPRHEPPAEFVQQVLAAVPPDTCLVVDIGLMLSNLDQEPEWAVVEVNPGFSSSNYGLTTEQFADFTIEAWRFSFTLGYSRKATN